MTVILMPGAIAQLEALTVHVSVDLKAMQHSAMVTLNNAGCVSDICGYMYEYFLFNLYLSFDLNFHAKRT